MNFIVKTGVFCIIEVWQEQDISYLVPQIFRNRGGKVSDDTKQTQEVSVLRSAQPATKAYRKKQCVFRPFPR